MTGSRQSLRVVPDESFGSLLRRRRRTDDLTQAQLGKMLDVTQQTIGAWERGERPQSGKLDAIAQYLRMDKERLVSLIDGQLPWPSGQAHVSEAAEGLADGEVSEEPPDSEASEEPADSKAADEAADSNDAMMRRLANSFMTAEKKGPLSSQRAEAYLALFEYFGRNQIGTIEEEGNS